MKYLLTSRVSSGDIISPQDDPETTFNDFDDFDGNYQKEIKIQCRTRTIFVPMNWPCSLELVQQWKLRQVNLFSCI